jgi:hypothetical protein
VKARLIPSASTKRGGSISLIINEFVISTLY